MGMVDKVKEDICRKIDSCRDYDLLDLVWRLLYKSEDREALPPYDVMTDEERGTWEWLKGKTKNKKN